MDTVLHLAVSGSEPQFPLLAAMALLYASCALPMPGRGARLQRRDPWRGFVFESRRTVLSRANHQCEAPAFVAWGRCQRPAEVVGHVYPWSKGGPTIASNGQALCEHHHRATAHRRLPWWYVLSLERRRRTYYPADAPEQVSAVMSPADWDARLEWARLGHG